MKLHITSKQIETLKKFKDKPGYEHFIELAKGLIADHVALRDENERLRTALHFYARNDYRAKALEALNKGALNESF